LYPYVCQDFEHDIYRILKNNHVLVSKYKRMVLVIRNQKSHLRDITTGFRNFCKQHPISAVVVSDIKTFEIKPGDAYIVVYDNDLEFLVRYSLKNQLELGVDIGVVSYNDTPLKGIIASGITTISTDFVQMGKTMADMILNQRKLWIDNPFVMNIRSSF